MALYKLRRMDERYALAGAGHPDAGRPTNQVVGRTDVLEDGIS